MAQPLPVHRSREYETLFIVTPESTTEAVEKLARRLTETIDKLDVESSSRIAVKITRGRAGRDCLQRRRCVEPHLPVGVFQSGDQVTHGVGCAQSRKGSASRAADRGRLILQ